MERLPNKNRETLVGFLDTTGVHQYSSTYCLVIVLFLLEFLKLYYANTQKYYQMAYPNSYAASVTAL